MDAFPNEPMGFRGILWGQRLESLTGRTFLPLSEEGDVSSYRLQNDSLRIGNAEVSDIIYRFFRHRFYRATVLIDSYENFARIKESFFDSYGEGVSVSREETETYYWSGAELDLSLEFSEATCGRIEYSFRPIHKQEEKKAKLKAIQDWDQA
ncbi:hypothetical protein SAMN04489760_11151 [Syntrophus gentianae]|uniref:Uncharacterized protein n=1 Tax=Syntrophus gentianae TaxID=43775 RepID=A0A1H7XPG1_9BACT|nr:hypothetical protein [Syntrophus gentianae]SEM34879.1 hypothetical protein SAMN04489760_11151 [Syntrophus gentianae]